MRNDAFYGMNNEKQPATQKRENIAFEKPICYYEDTKSALRQIRSEKMKTYDTLLEAVEKNRRLILDTERYIWKHPETGYKEWKTSAYLEQAFEKLGYTLTKADGIPGFYADADTGRPGPTIAVLGEMDALICADHPEADPQTGAVHACGHHAQCAALLGVAAALKEPGALDGICGNVRLMAVPAEELIEIGYRETLRQQGIIHYFGGKVEFLFRGYLDGVDIAMMVHSSAISEKSLILYKGNNGCMVKNIRYVGRSGHAASPHDGINALYAATLGLQAVNNLRETFQEKDCIRFHPIITKGGDVVNAIPDDVRIESYVRGASIDAIAAVNCRINRALAAGAAAIGAKVHLTDYPGYMPMHNDPNLNALAAALFEQIVGHEGVVVLDDWTMGSTDMGDLSAVMPVIQAMASGASGIGHGNNYYISDPESACVNAAKAMTLLSCHLLAGQGEEAERIIANAKPVFASKEAYFEAVDKMFLDKEAVFYHEDGTVTLDYCNL